MPDVRFHETHGRYDHPDASRELDVLYLTYDGLLEPLGRSQIVNYLVGLAALGLQIEVVSFEKPADLEEIGELQAMRARLDAASIRWSPLPYHRHPRALATLWDVLRGSLRASKLARARRPTWIHARSYLAGLMGAAARSASHGKLLFDMRGFWPEERVELRLFATDGLLYRASKRCERYLLEASDHVVVLTHKAKAVLRDREAGRRLATQREVRETPVTVVPCCVDTDRFTPRAPDRELAARHGLVGKLVIGNIGTFNERYLVSDMFRFAFHVREHRPELVFVYLTWHDPIAVQRAARSAGLAEDALVVVKAQPEDVPRWLSLFRLGVFFLRPSYAAKASSFTKLGEFLSSGVPVATNTGVGDVDDLLGDQKCGVLVPGLTDRDLDAAARQALPLLEGPQVPDEMRARCRALAMKELSLPEGLRRYQMVYGTSAPETATRAEANEESKDLARVAGVS